VPRRVRSGKPGGPSGTSNGNKAPRKTDYCFARARGEGHSDRRPKKRKGRGFGASTTNEKVRELSNQGETSPYRQKRRYDARFRAGGGTELFIRGWGEVWCFALQAENPSMLTGANSRKAPAGGVLPKRGGGGGGATASISNRGLFASPDHRRRRREDVRALLQEQGKKKDTNRGGISERKSGNERSATTESREEGFPKKLSVLLERRA